MPATEIRLMTAVALPRSQGHSICGAHMLPGAVQCRHEDALAKPRSEWVIRLRGATAGQRRECAP
jgi:hypothetical protein